MMSVEERKAKQKACCQAWRIKNPHYSRDYQRKRNPPKFPRHYKVSPNGIRISTEERLRRSRERYQEDLEINRAKSRNRAKKKYQANPELAYKKTKAYLKAHPDLKYLWQRRTKILKNYKMTLDQYDELLKSQSGVCAICQKVDTRTRSGRTIRMAVDHNHNCCPGSITCGKCIRGILCAACNGMLGALEATSWRVKAEKYLEQYK